MRMRAAVLVLSAGLLSACGSGGGGGGNPPPSTPVISLSSSALTFSAWTGKTQAAQLVAITNGGAGTLAVPSANVQYTSGSGWLSATVTGASAPYTLSVTAQPGTLTPGTYTATIQLTSAGATPAMINATLTVTQSWTVFVYGSADHNLTPSLLTDMLEMGAATLTSNVNVIVAADYCSGLRNGGQPYTVPWTNAAVPSGTEWYQIRGGGLDPQLLGTEAEQNFDDPAVLRQAVADVFSSFPADRYGIVMWDHGGSWNGGFGGDWANDPANRAPGMKGGTVAAAVSNGLADAGVAGTRRLEFFAFDTCLMAANEVAFDFRNLSKTYLACAEIDYGDGWNYAPTLSWISNNPSGAATAFATNEVTYWNQQHLGGVDDQLMRSHVALDTAKFATYADRWKDIITAMDASTTLDLLEVARKQYAVSPGYAFQSDPMAVTSYRDAGLFLAGAATFTSDATVASAAATANTALTDAILGSSQGSIRAGAGQKGVHFEMPAASAWSASATAYKALAWDTHTQWSLLLDALAATADATDPTVVTSIANATNPDAANPPTVDFGSADADVAEARVYIAQPAGGPVYFYGLAGQAFVDPGSAYRFTWRGKLIQLTDGTHVSAITLLPWVSGASPVYLTPGALSFQGTTYEAMAAIDGMTSQVIVLFVDVGGETSSVSLATAAGATFTPVVYDFVSGNMVAATALTIPTANPALTAVVLSAPAGNYAIITAMGDVWGNWGSAADAVTISTPF